MDPLQPSKCERLKGVHALYKPADLSDPNAQAREKRGEKLQPTNMKAQRFFKERLPIRGETAATPQLTTS